MKTLIRAGVENCNMTASRYSTSPHGVDITAAKQVDDPPPPRYDAPMTTDPNPEFSADKVKDDREVWVKTYIHVWSDLSKGVFDKAAVQKAAEEHWEQSPQSDAIQVAAMDFIKTS
jgi:hypothetical protein